MAAVAITRNLYHFPMDVNSVTSNDMPSRPTQPFAAERLLNKHITVRHEL